MTERRQKPGAVTQILMEVRRGDSNAIDRLFSIVYNELRRVAANLMRQERCNHTLQPTALVNEAFLRLAGTSEMSLDDRAHFFAVASRAMRRVLVDHARVKLARKRGGEKAQVELDDLVGSVEVDLEQTIAVDEALTRLEKLDASQAKILEMQYFIGNSIDEIAAVTGLSKRTTKRELQTARLFLAEQLHAVGLKLK